MADILNRPRNEISCQTDHDPFEEANVMAMHLNQMRDEFEHVKHENFQMRGVMDRQMVDIDRLIDEKRHLEKDLETKSNRMFELERRPVRESSNNNASRLPPPQATGIVEETRFRNLNRVMAEKDNYI